MKAMKMDFDFICVLPIFDHEISMAVGSTNQTLTYTYICVMHSSHALYACMWFTEHLRQTAFNNRFGYCTSNEVLVERFNAILNRSRSIVILKI